MIYRTNPLVRLPPGFMDLFFLLGCSVALATSALPPLRSTARPPEVFIPMDAALFPALFALGVRGPPDSIPFMA